MTSKSSSATPRQVNGAQAHHLHRTSFLLPGVRATSRSLRCPVDFLRSQSSKKRQTLKRSFLEVQPKCQGVRSSLQATSKMHRNGCSRSGTKNWQQG